MGKAGDHYILRAQPHEYLMHKLICILMHKLMFTADRRTHLHICPQPLYSLMHSALMSKKWVNQIKKVG